MNIYEQLTNLILGEKKNKIVSLVEEKTGCHCSRIDDELNNGVIKDGVKIMIDEENSEIIHFDEVEPYSTDPFISDKKLDTMSNIIEKIFKERKKEFLKLQSSINKDMILKGVRKCVINYELNKHRLMNNHIFFEKYLDFAIIYQVFPKTYGRIKSDYRPLLIKNKDFGKYGFTKEELETAATQNLKFFREIPFGEILLVISNNEFFYGAGAITNLDLIDLIADEYGENLFIIPSSVHEIILFDESAKSEDIKDIVMSINNTEISNIDFLSNNIYQYDRKGKRINIVY